MTETDTNQGGNWAPVDACRLPADGLVARLDAFEGLFASSVRAVERLEPTWLRLVLSPTPDVAANAAELTVREADCCGFFTFTLTATQDRLVLDVTVPANRVAVLDGLTAQAEAARRPE